MHDVETISLYCTNVLGLGLGLTDEEGLQVTDQNPEEGIEMVEGTETEGTKVSSVRIHI